MGKLKIWWIKLRTSLWFLPAIMVAGAILLAAGLVEIEGLLSEDRLKNHPRLFGAGAEGARGMLGTIAGSMATIAGVAFSITIVVLSLASSEYTPRILRNFIRDRANQTVLGVFVGVFVYCLLVQRTIRSEGEGDFVPSVAVAFALVLALVGVGFFIFFIHHIATSIQASSIIASAAKETIETIEDMYPDEQGESATDDEDEFEVELVANQLWHEIPSRGTGYLQSVDLDKLVMVAKKLETVIKMECSIGEFIVEGQAVASVALESAPNEKTIEQVNKAYEIDRFRTVEQDPAFGIRQLVDIALKALSPGVNDTTTALTSIDYISAICGRLTQRRIAALRLYDGEKLRVLGRGPTFEDLLDEAFDQIRGSARDNTAVILRMLAALRSIALETASPKRLRQISAHAGRLKELADRNVESNYDRRRIEEAIKRVFCEVENAKEPSEG